MSVSDQYSWSTGGNFGGQPFNGLPPGTFNYQPRQYGHTNILDYLVDTCPPPTSPKERIMSTKSAEIAAVRAKEREARIAELIERYEKFIADEIGDTPGNLFHASAKFPDSDTVYHYAFVYGSNKRWYQTNQIGGKTTAELVDLLVATTLDAESFEVE